MPAAEAPSHPTSDGALRAGHPYRAFVLRIGLGVAIVAFLLSHYDARPALRTLARERPLYFAAAVGIYLGCQALSAFRWQLLAAILNLHGPYLEFLRYYYVGAFTNLFVPGLVGGDAARSFYLGRRHSKMGEAIASAVADRGFGLLALFWVAAIVALTMNRGALPASVIRPVIAVGALTFAGYLASPTVARMIHLMPRPIRRALGIIAPYLHKRAPVLTPIGLSMILQVSLALAQYLLALGLGLYRPLSVFLLVVPISGVFASLPVTLNGLGLRETAYLLLFGMVGVSRENAIALGLLMFAATTIGGMFGAIAFITTELPAPYSQADPG